MGQVRHGAHWLQRAPVRPRSHTLVGSRGTSPARRAPSIGAASSAGSTLADDPHTVGHSYWHRSSHDPDHHGGGAISVLSLADTVCLLKYSSSACSVAASYMPPMLVTRVRLPACAFACARHTRAHMHGVAQHVCLSWHQGDNIALAVTRSSRAMLTYPSGVPWDKSGTARTQHRHCIERWPHTCR